MTSPVIAALSPPSWTALAVPLRFSLAGPERAPLRRIAPLVEVTLTVSVARAPRTPAPVQVPEGVVPAGPPMLPIVPPLSRVKAEPTMRLP